VSMGGSGPAKSAPAPNKRILHAMRQRHRVLMVNEPCTTAFDYDTKLLLKRVWGDGRGQVVRGLLWCDNSVANINNSGSCRCFVSRDGNAACSMRWIEERGGDNRRPTSWSTRSGRRCTALSAGTLRAEPPLRAPGPTKPSLGPADVAGT
jgi:hypothetical protein